MATELARQACVAIGGELVSLVALLLSVEMHSCERPISDIRLQQSVPILARPAPRPAHPLFVPDSVQHVEQKSSKLLPDAIEELLHAK